MSSEADNADSKSALSRRLKIAFGAGGIAIACGSISLAIFRGVTAFTLVDLSVILYVVGGALLVHVLAGIIAGTKAVARSFRAPKRESQPWRYRALPDESESGWSILLYAKTVMLLSTLVALALIAVAALVMLPIDWRLMLTLFEAFLFVLVASAFASIVLTAAGRIELMLRRRLSRRGVSREPT